MRGAAALGESMDHPRRLGYWSGDPYLEKIPTLAEPRTQRAAHSTRSAAGRVKPISMAFTAAWVRSETPSFLRTRSMCLLTVERERCSSLAIPRF